MDMSYATIHVFGQPRRLYRENLMKYMVRSKERLNNHPIYLVHSDMESFILYHNLCLEEDSKNKDNISEENDGKLQGTQSKHNEDEEGLWNMDFDGVASKEGARASVWIMSPKVDKSRLCSYKLAFDYTKIVAEYQALILGLHTLKDLGAKKIVVHGYLELVINQIKGVYQTKHPRMRAYRNFVLEMMHLFSEYDLFVIPIEDNIIVDALATSPSVFKTPIYPNRKYEIEVKHRPVVPDNVKYWQFFKDDNQLDFFFFAND